MQGPSQLSREQQQALALAQAKRKRAEAEAQTPAAKAPPASMAPVAKAPPMASNGAGMGSVNPMVEMGQRAQKALPAGYVRPEVVNRENPIVTAQRAGQTQAGNAWAAQEEARKAEEARLRQELKEANALSAGGGGLPLYRNERGDIRPGSPTDTDMSKGIVASPIHAERAAVSAAEATANLPLDIAKASAVPVTAMFDPSFQGAMAGAEYGVGVDTLSDRLSQAYEAGGYGDLQKKMDAGQRLDFSGAKIPVPDELQSVSGSVAEGFMQYLFARGLVGKMMPGGKLPLQLTKDAAALGGGFLGDSGRTADMIDPETMGFMRDYVRWLKTDQADSPFMGRIKNMTEDATINLLLMGLGRGGKALANAADGVAAVPTNAGGNWRNAPAAAQPQPATAVPPTRPASAPVQPQPAAQAAPQPPAPVQTATAPPIPPQPPVGGPPVAAGAAGNPPGVPVAQAAQTPPPGTLTPVPQLGEAEVWLNNLDRPTREAVMRTFESSGVPSKNTLLGKTWSDEQLAIIRDLNVIPDGRNSQNAFLASQKWDWKYPSLRENLSNIGGGFAVTSPRAPDQKILGMFGGKADKAQSIMDTQGRKQVVSERGFLERSAATNFGAPSDEVAQQLKNELQGLGNRYNFLLSPTKKRKFGTDKLVKLEENEAELKKFLQQPWIIRSMPPQVRDRLMVDASEELRNLGWTADELKQMAGPTREKLAPLFEASGPLEWSPQMWEEIAKQYPRFAAHVLQSSYAKAARGLASGMDAANNAGTIGNLNRMRGIDKDGNVIPGSLLDRLEKTMPNADFSFTGAGSYADTRRNWGDIKGAQEAFDVTRRFKAAAQSGTDVASIIDEMDNLSPRGKEAAFSEISSFINDSMGNKVSNLTPGQAGTGAVTAPNLTQIGNDNFLRALRKVFGKPGDNLANDIELARSSTTFNTDINRRINSRTETNAQAVKESPKLYENAAGIEGGIIDNNVKLLGGGAGLLAVTNPGAIPLLAIPPAVNMAWNAFKRGKRLTNSQRNQLADFWFRSREAGVNPEELLNKPPGGRGPSMGDYAGAMARDAAIGAGVGYGASGGDPEAAALGAAGGAAFGVGRARVRNARSIIKPPPAGPRGGNALRTGGNPPSAVGPRGTPRIPPGDAGFAGVTPLAAMAGGTGGFLAAPDVNGDGTVDIGERAAFAALGTAGGYGAGRKLSKPRPAGNALKSGPAKAPPANVTALPKSDKANSSDLQKALQAYIEKPRTKWDDAFEKGKINAAEYDWYSGGGTAEELQKTKANMLETLKTAEDYPADRVWEVYSKDPSAKMALELLAADGNQRAMAIRYEAERMRAIPRQTKRMWAIMGEPQVSVAPLADLAGAIGDDVAVETAKSFARMSEQPFLVARAKAIKTADEAYALLRDAHKLINGKDGRPAWAERLIRDARNNEGKFTPPKAKATPKADVVPFGAAQKAPPAKSSETIDLGVRYPKTVEVGNVRLRYFVENGRITISEMDVPRAMRGKGNASKVLDGIVRQADEHGLEIKLIANSYDGGPLSNDQLVGFYKSRGFELDPSSPIEGAMIRRPSSSAQKAPPASPSTTKAFTPDERRAWQAEKGPVDDTPLYHGTAVREMFDEFSGPTWLHKDRNYAQDFAWETGPDDPFKAHVIEAYARGRFKDVDEKAIERIGYDPEQIAALKREGYDGAKSPDGQVLVFDPKDIRRTDKPSPPVKPSGAPKPPPVRDGAGFGGSKLPMDEASRKARAEEQGFDTRYKLFHASHSDFDAFDTNKIRTDLQLGEDAIFLTNSPAVADSYLGGAFVQRDAPKIIEKGAQGVNMGDGIGRYYSKGAAVYPVYARNLKDYEVWDMGGGGYDPEFMQRAIKEAKANGAPGVILRGTRDPGIMDNIGPQGNPRKPSAVVVVFDPKDIRSVNAKFDPAQSSSSKLLNGFGTDLGSKATYASAGGGIAYGELGPLEDLNNDGVKDEKDRAAMRMKYGMGGIMTPLLVRGGVGMAKSLGNKLKGGKAPPKPQPRGVQQGTFAGVNAKNADRAALLQARNLERMGASREEIFDQTGWFRGTDKQWRFEIDDTKADLKAPIRREFNKRGSVSVGGDGGVFMMDALKHDKLQKQYPGALGATFKAEINPVTEASGGYTPSEYGTWAARQIEATAPNPEQLRSTALHEVQHSIQDTEGFAIGGNADLFREPQYAAMVQDEAERLAALDGKTLQSLGPVSRDLYAANARENLYKRLAGEVEARNVQKRDEMRRRGEDPGYPWATEDGPADQQIVRTGTPERADARPGSRPMNVPSEQPANPVATKADYSVRGFKETRDFEPRDMVLAYNEGDSHRDIAIAMGLDPERVDATQLASQLSKNIRRKIEEVDAAGQLRDMAKAWNVDEAELRQFMTGRPLGGKQERWLTDLAAIVENANAKGIPIDYVAIGQKLNAKGHKISPRNLKVILSEARNGKRPISPSLQDRLKKIRITPARAMAAVIGAGVGANMLAVGPSAQQRDKRT